MNRDHFVYRCYDNAGSLLYVGCTKNLDRRRYAHYRESEWFLQATRFRVSGPYSKTVARAMESAAIASEQPRWNVMGTDRTFGKRVTLNRVATAACIAESALTADELAAQLNVTPRFLRSFTEGMMPASREFGNRLANELGTSLAVLTKPYADTFRSAA